MSLQDFDGCTPQQFMAIFEAWQEREERRRRNGWEQSRFMVCGVLSSYSKKALEPSDVCVFSWEKDEIAGQARNDGNGGRNGGTGGNDGNGGDDGDGGDEIAGQARNDDRERAKKIRELWCK